MHGSDIVGATIGIFLIGAGFGYYVAKLFFGI
jgi:hypothetical protein